MKPNIAKYTILPCRVSSDQDGGTVLWIPIGIQGGETGLYRFNPEGTGI